MNNSQKNLQLNQLSRKAQIQFMRDNLRNQTQQKRMEINQNQPASELDKKLSYLKLIKDSKLKNLIISSYYQQSDLSQLQDHIKNIFSDDIYCQHLGVIKFRQCSVDPNFPFQQIFDSNVIPQLLKISQKEHYPHLMLESNWILANLSSFKKDIDKLFSKDILQIIFKNIQNQFVEVQNQALWCLKNLLTYPQGKSQVIINDDYQLILKQLYFKNLENQDPFFLNLLIQSINQLFFTNFNSQKSVNFLKQFLDILINAFISNQNLQIQGEIILAIYRCVRNDYIKKFATEEFLLKLKNFIEIQFLNQEDYQIVDKAITILGGITSSENAQFTDMVIQIGFLQILQKYLLLDESQLQTKIIWIYGNISVGTEYQKQCLLSEQGVFDSLMKLTLHSNVQTQEEAAWTLFGLCKSKSSQIMNFIIEKNILKLIYRYFDKQNKNIKLKKLAQEGLLEMLCIFQNNGNLEAFKLRLFQEGILQELEHMQREKDQILYIRALFILENFFVLKNEFVQLIFTIISSNRKHILYML